MKIILELLKMEDSTLPAGWIKCLSKKFQQIYYFNTQTNETSWIHPVLKQEKVSTEKKESTDPPKKKKKKKSKTEKDTTKQTKSLINKAKEKVTNDSKKLTAKDLEKLGSNHHKKAEKVALWAESVTIKQKMGTNHTQVKEKSSKRSETVDDATKEKIIKEKIKKKLAEKTRVVESSKGKEKKQKEVKKSGSADLKDFKIPKNKVDGNLNSKFTEKTEKDGSSYNNPFTKKLANTVPQKQAQQSVTGSFGSDENLFRKHQVESVESMNEEITPAQCENQTHYVHFSRHEERRDVLHDTEPLQAQALIVEESMDIDDAVEFSREIMKEIRELRSENIVERPTLNENAPVEVRNNILTDALYIVVDTNILLAHLKFISELKDYLIPGIGAPILYIPWMVFQELDSLKDANKRYHNTTTAEGGQKSFQLNMLARKAINFINTCLEGEHPRVKGENAIEAGTPIDGFVEESNDDAIIHAAMSLKLRASNSSVIMLSNDKNLCNKAMIAGVKAFSQQNIMMGIRSMFQSGTVAIRKENFQEYFDTYKVQEIIAERRKQADELSCELQCILREGLSTIIELDMKEAYGDDLWLQIVKIQPPWTLQDVLVLLEKHWIAVFGHIVERSVIKVVENLKNEFQASEGVPGSLESTKCLIDNAFLLFSKFAIHSNYNDMTTKCLAGITVLLDKCVEYIQNQKQNPELPPSSEVKKDVILDTPATNKPNDKDDNISTISESPHEKVLQTFDAIWKTVTHYSALIFHSLNFPSQLVKDLDPNEPKPHPKEASACLMVMTRCLLNLIGRIQDVIRIPAEHLVDSEQFIVKLLESINTFMKEVMKLECHVSPTELLYFSQDKNTRTALVQGLSQLDRSYAMLQQCIDYQRTMT